MFQKKRRVREERRRVGDLYKAAQRLAGYIREKWDGRWEVMENNVRVFGSDDAYQILLLAERIAKVN